MYVFLLQIFVIMEELFNDNFPHIGEQIFGYLKPDDFLNCRLVCKNWKKTLDENTKLWKKIALDIIYEYQENRDHEHWTILWKALNSDDFDTVKKVTLVLIWYVKEHICRLA